MCFQSQETSFTALIALQAINDTFSVVALVALLAVSLFALNTGLNEASKQYYVFAKESSLFK